MIDGTNTTVDWQRHPTDILILPVGAFEQHSVHLPLATDTLQANHFAKLVAEDLNAALLPTIAIATSMEHTGYRGSFSLRPETLMQIVRDIADDAERQNFRILIVLNAHGGNHALVPVCRDINRRDRPLKIILAYYWEHSLPMPPGPPARPGLNFHANEMETSVMLALHPELVGPERADAQYTPEPHPLIQSDLTTFGVGYISPSGAVGWPSDGSAARGRDYIAAVRAGLIPHLQDRIARLRAHPRYAGPAGLAIRPLLPDDTAAGMRLKTIAGWNQTEADWHMLLAAAPDGCFGMVHQGRVVGTATTTSYGSVAWIGMVLVDPEFRGLGIATRLMDHALAHLANVETIKLDATPAGRAVYRKLGFADEYNLRRLTHHAVPARSGDTTATRPMAESDLAQIMALDLTAFGSNRAPILRALWSAAPTLCHVLETRGAITGYAFGRPGTNFTQIGPLVAASSDDALRLTHAALRPLTGKPALLDIPDAQSALRAFLADAGFTEERAFTRIFRGPNRTPGNPQHLFAAGGPEIG